MRMKEKITEYIRERNYAGIVALGKENNTQALRYIQMNIWGDYRLAQRWYAIEALEVLAEHFAEQNDEAYRNVLRRALWAMNDESGNVPWAAPEMMAAVIKSSPQQFGDFIKLMITNGLDNPMCHVGVLWSAGYLGRDNLKEIEPFLPKLQALLQSKDSEVRGYAVWCLSQLQPENLQEQLTMLEGDTGIVHLYQNGIIRKMTVGEVIQERG